MNFKLNTKINLSNITKYTNNQATTINYKHQNITYTPEQATNHENKEVINTTEESKSNENITADEEKETVSFEEGYRRGLEQNNDNLANLFEGNEVASNVAMGAGGFANGLGNFGENIVDGTVTLGTIAATPFTGIYDLATGSHVTEDMYNASGAFVEEEHVNNAFEYLYTETEVGQTINENASETMQYGNAGYNTAVGAGYLTGTVVTAGTLSTVSPLGIASSGAIISGTAGTGRGTSDALNNGANMQQASAAGILTGAWEGGQWLFGAKIAGHGFTTIALDSASGAADPLFRSGIQSIYNGQSFATNFEQNGGITSMATNAFVAGSFSTIGEIPTFKSAADSAPSTITSDAEQVNIGSLDSVTLSDTHLNMETSSGTTINSSSQSFSNIGLSDSNATDRIIIDTYSAPIRNHLVTDSNVEVLLNNIDILKKNDSSFTITTDSSVGTAYLGYINTININPNNLEPASILHETGHAYYHSYNGEGFLRKVTPTEHMQAVIQDAQQQIKNNPEKVAEMFAQADLENQHCLDLTNDWYSQIEQSENTRIANIVDELYETNDTEGLKKIIDDSANIESVRKDLENAGLDASDIDSILSDKELVTSIAQSQNAFQQKNQFYYNLMSDPNEGLDARRTYSMINSIMQDTEIKLSTGETVTCDFGHQNQYWSRENGTIDLTSYRLSYDELMADYFSISALGRQDLIDNLRSVAGNELFDSLSNDYGQIVNTAKEQGLI